MSVLCLGSVLWKRAKNDHFHEGGKVGMSKATPIKLFSVDSYDLKSMSFKFSNDIFIIFEMPGSSYQRPIAKNNVSLLFRPFVIRGPWFDSQRFHEFFYLFLTRNVFMSISSLSEIWILISCKKRFVYIDDLTKNLQHYHFFQFTLVTKHHRWFL